MSSFALKASINCAAFAALLVSGWVNSAQDHFADKFSHAAEVFGSYSGCALILNRDRHEESRFEYGATQCTKQISPCSTFKIPNALIGLQQGVVSGRAHKKQWDGKKHRREINNRDHTLESAIEYSVVWYFQSLANDVGVESMQNWLQRIDYGNQDISGGIDAFWLSNSLKINAYEQLELLIALKHQTLPFQPAYQQQVQDMLVRDSELAGVLHGKTGSCPGTGDAEPDHGWFVGWVDWDKNQDRNPATTWFIINIMGDEAWGWNAQSIALEFLKELQP